MSAHLSSYIQVHCHQRLQLQILGKRFLDKFQSFQHLSRFEISSCAVNNLQVSLLIV